MTELPQQREVLHVARANLEDVGVPVDQLDLAEVHHFGNQFQVLGARRVPEQAQPFLAEPLEAVRRAARLERAAAEDLRARSADRGRRGAHLVLVLGRARTGHDDDLVAAQPDVANHDDRSFGFERPAGELVRRRDPQDLVDAVQHLDEPGVRQSLAHGAEDGPLDARRPVDVHPHFHQARDDLRDLLFGGSLLHDYDHSCCLASAALTSDRHPTPR